MTEFTSKDDILFIDGKEVLRGWESYSGMYWFATSIRDRQDSIIDGMVHEGDIIYWGLVQNQYGDTWGPFSLAELESISRYKLWEIPKRNLPWSGKRN